MTIDHEDHAPRPADDWHGRAFTPAPKMPNTPAALRRQTSLSFGRHVSEWAANCDQFGCRFDAFPHAI